MLKMYVSPSQRQQLDKESRDLGDRWYNPLTGVTVSKRGPTYARSRHPITVSRESCDQLAANPYYNPLTQRILSSDNNVYAKLRRMCNSPELRDDRRELSVHRSPSQMSPRGLSQPTIPQSPQDLSKRPSQQPTVLSRTAPMSPRSDINTSARISRHTPLLPRSPVRSLPSSPRQPVSPPPQPPRSPVRSLPPQSLPQPKSPLSSTPSLEWYKQVYTTFRHILEDPTYPEYSPQLSLTAIIDTIKNMDWKLGKLIYRHKDVEWLLNAYTLLTRIPDLQYPILTDINNFKEIRDVIDDMVTSIKNRIDRNRALIIGEHKIHQISGPVTYTVLAPQKFRLIDGTTYIMPVLLLFGDVHQSLENQCQPCQPNQTCVNIYDKSFISILDEFGVDHDVAFYLEAASDIMYRRSENIQQGLPMTKYELLSGHEREDVIMTIHQYIQPCFYHEYTGQPLYEEGCPAKHVKWHFADARQFNNGMIKSPQRKVKRWFETALSFFTHYVFNLDFNTNNFVTWNLRYFCEYNQIDFITLMQDFESILTGLCDRNPSVFRDLLFQKYAAVSIIVHQLRESPFKSIWEQSWFVLYNQLAHANISDTDLSNFKRSVNSVFAQIRDDSSNLVIDNYAEIGATPIMLAAPILDIYTLTRMTKGPSGDFTIVYAGDHHITQMVRFLESVSLARTVGKSDNRLLDLGLVNRCVKFEYPIDINQLVHDRHME